MKIIKRLLLLVPVLVISFLFITVNQSNAETNKAINKSAWVQDNAKILNKKTVSEIDKINKNDLSKIKGHPEYAVITLNGIPKNQDIDDYAHDTMNKLGIGKPNWHNGILLVIDAKHHKNRLEVGTGLQSALPDGDKNKIVTAKVQDYFKNNQYNNAVTKFSDNLFNVLYESKGEVLTPKETKHAENVNKKSKTFGEHVYNGFVYFFTFIVFAFMFGIFFTIIHGFYRAIKFRMQNIKMKKVLNQHPEAVKKLELDGIENPQKELNKLTIEDRKRIFNKSKVIDVALLVALIAMEYKSYKRDPNKHNNNDGPFGGFFFGDDSGIFSGVSDVFDGIGSVDGSDFGSDFGGDFGGSDGGGFDF